MYDSGWGRGGDLAPKGGYFRFLGIVGFGRRMERSLCGIENQPKGKE